MSKKIETTAELTAAIMDWGAKHQTAMNGLIDKMPEPLKTEFMALKNGLNDTLSKLKLIDAVPAATEASYALNSFASTINYMMEYADGLRTRLAGILEDSNKKALAVQGFETQIEKGELMHKDKFTPLIDTAREEGKNKAMELVASTRKSMIALAGLPEAGQDILALGATEFDAAVTQAKSNIELLKKKGLVLGGKGDAWVKDLAWQGAQAFQGQMTKIEELVTGAPAKSPVGEPLLGAGGAGVGKEEKKEGNKTVLKLA